MHSFDFISFDLRTVAGPKWKWNVTHTRQGSPRQHHMSVFGRRDLPHKDWCAAVIELLPRKTGCKNSKVTNLHSYQVLKKFEKQYFGQTVAKLINKFLLKQRWCLVKLLSAITCERIALESQWKHLRIRKTASYPMTLKMAGCLKILAKCKFLIFQKRFFGNFRENSKNSFWASLLAFSKCCMGWTTSEDPN